MGSRAVLASTSLPVEPGRSAETTLTVHNTGGVVDRFTFEALGPMGEHVTFEPDALSLFPDATGTVRVVVAPPRQPDVAAGSVPLGLRVASQEDPQGGVTEELTVELAAFSAVGAELLPRVVFARRAGSARLAVDNRSNIAYDATLEAADAAGGIRFAFHPAVVSVPPGGAVFARVRVRPQKPFWKGPDRARPFQIGLVCDTAPHPPRVPVDASMLQSALVPRWVLRVLAILVALAILAVILWYTLLRPQIRSTATNVVKSQLAAAGLTPSGSSAPASSSGSSGSSGTHSATAPSSGATSSNSAAPATSNTSSLTVNGSGTGSGNSNQVIYTVPAGYTLQMTDILVQNAAGDNGSIALARGGTVLMQWSMADFRDLDYHWISPTIFGSGSKVVMQVSGCTNTCHPGIYYAGSLVKLP